MEPQITVSAEDFFKVELRVGKVEKAEPLENSEKLLRLVVAFGDEKRTILAGLKPFFEPDYFTGKLFVFAYNLEPRKMAGEESQGMLLCVDPIRKPTASNGASSGKPLPLEAPEGAQVGDKIK